MSATSDMAGVSHRLRFGSGLSRWVTGLFPARRRLLRQSAPVEEAVVATLGLVQVRRSRAGVVARTAVKGEREAALQTALGRLASYVDGDNREGLPVQAAKPVVQRSNGPGRWLVQIGLPGIYTPFMAPVPYNRKVRILPQPSETLAIMRLSGRPRKLTIARGEAAILAAITGSGWSVAGAPSFRFHAPSGLLPWTGGFEIAVPVTTN